jgi:hypothetical protein
VTRERCEHGNIVCSLCLGPGDVSDEAKRCFDIINSYVAYVPYEERVRSWVAVRLSDGGSDGVLYHSKRDAVRYQLDEFLCAYFSYRNSPSGFASKTDAELWLRMHRAYYDQGFRLPDPDAKDGGKDVIQPLDAWQYRQQINRLNDPAARN